MKGRMHHPEFTRLPHLSLRRLATLLFALTLCLSIVLLEASPLFALDDEQQVAQTPAPPTRCTVQVNGLNLRPGPDTLYIPIVSVLSRNTALTPIERTQNSAWIHVTVDATDDEGWVNTQENRVSCNRPIARLPIVKTLPPRTGTVSTRSAVLPPGGGGGAPDILAEFTAPAADATFLYSEVRGFSFTRFDERMWVRFHLTGIPRGTEVESITFRFTGDYEGTEIYDDEVASDFCYFGGAPPNCTVVVLDEGVTWPGTDIEITNGSYTYNVTVALDDGEERNWTGAIHIASDELPPDPDPFGLEPGVDERPSVASIVASIAEVSPGSADPNVSDALVLRVVANDPDVGSANARGISSVSWLVTDPDDIVILSEFDDTPPYCAFGDNGVACTVYDFLDNGDVWPYGDAILEGQYDVEITVTAIDGEDKILRSRLTVDFSGEEGSEEGSGTGGETGSETVDASEDVYYAGDIAIDCDDSERVWFQGTVTQDGNPVRGVLIGFKSRLVSGTDPVTRPAVTDDDGYYSHWVDADASTARGKRLEIWVLASDGTRISDYIDWDTDGSAGSCNEATIDFYS